MTTTVTINACLSKEKEVLVTLKEFTSEPSDHTEPAEFVEREVFTLQDGESATRYVYDGREISVIEVMKNPTQI